MSIQKTPKPEDWGTMAPSKKNKWVLEQMEQKREDFSIDRACVFRFMSGPYCWYDKLARHTQALCYPTVSSVSVIRGDTDMPEHRLKDVIRYNDNGPMNGYTTAALRFVLGEEFGLDKHDFCLIQDVDIMMKAEDPDFVIQRCAQIIKHDLECYCNWVSSDEGDYGRMPGVHFVTKDWWPRTKKIRDKYRDHLLRHGTDDYAYDEKMIASIVAESGLKIQRDERHLWYMHGLHLGDVRGRLMRKIKPRPMCAPDRSMFESLIADEEYMALVEESEPYIPLHEIFEYYKQCMDA